MKKSKLIISISVIAAAVALCVGVILTHRAKVNPYDHLTVAFSGPSGYADMEASLDYTSMEKALWGENFFTSQKGLENALLLERSIRVDPVRDSFFSNGDTVTVTVSLDEATAKQLRVRFTQTSRTYTAENLPEPVYCDPFEGLTLVFSGKNGMGKFLRYDYTAPEAVLSDVEFSVSTGNALSNGDTVTVSVIADIDALKREGYLLRDYAKIYTVTGLDAPITSLQQLPQQVQDDLMADAKAKILDHAAGQRSYSFMADFTITDLEPYAVLVRVPEKPYNYLLPRLNEVAVVYKGHLSLDNRGVLTHTQYTGEAYFPVCYRDVLTSGTGDAMTGSYLDSYQGYGGGWYRDFDNLETNFNADYPNDRYAWHFYKELLG